MYIYFLPRWYERARERVRRKYGVNIDRSLDIKRAYQSNGLLGHKVWIDGFNNNFDASNESIYPTNSDKICKSDQTNRYSSYTNEEHEKILKIKTYMKQFGSDKNQRVKIASTSDHQKQQHPSLLAQHSLFGTKIKSISFTHKDSSEALENIVSSPELPDRQDSSSFINFDHQCQEVINNTKQPLNICRAQSASANLGSLESKKREFKNRPFNALKNLHPLPF